MGQAREPRPAVVAAIVRVDAFTESLRRRLRGPTPAGAGTGFTALSFNVGNGLAEPDRLVRHLQLWDADIVGLQELALGQARAIERQLAEQYPYRLLFPTGFSGKGLLSKHPIAEGGSVAFAPDRPDVYASVEVEGRPLRIIVAHPRPPAITLGGVVFDPVTRRQIEQVVDSAIDGRPAVVLGDFNMTPLQQEHQLLTSRGLIDAFQEVGVRSASFPRRVGHTHRLGEPANRVPLLPVIRIDYVWYTPELRAGDVWVEDDAGSDHLPVVARLSWREPMPREESTPRTAQ